MDEKFRAKYYRIEEEHAWSVSRRDIIMRLMDKAPLPLHARVLDVGCSSGVLLQQLEREGFEVEGIDVSDLAVELAQGRGLDVHKMDTTELSFDDDSFDALVASDVLEHVEDESAALSEWRRVLRPDGTAIIFVPCFNFLWSEHDVINGHVRRYTKGKLVRTVRDAGFEIRRAGYWNAALFAPTTATRLVGRVMPKANEAIDDDFEEVHPTLNRVLRELMVFENRLISSHIPMPIGVSAFVVATPSA